MAQPHSPVCCRAPHALHVPHGSGRQSPAPSLLQHRALSRAGCTRVALGTGRWLQCRVPAPAWGSQHTRTGMLQLFGKPGFINAPRPHCAAPAETWHWGTPWCWWVLTMGTPAQIALIRNRAEGEAHKPSVTSPQHGGAVHNTPGAGADATWKLNRKEWADPGATITPAPRGLQQHNWTRNRFRAPCP